MAKQCLYTIHRIAHVHQSARTISAYPQPIGIRIARVAMGDGLLMEQVLGDSGLNQQRPQDLPVNSGSDGRDRVLYATRID